MTSQLPQLDPITRLSPRVVRILGGNPGRFTLQGSNTYLLGTGPGRILLDTGEGNAIWPKALSTALEQEAAEIETVLLSHWHPDHVGGVKDVKALSPNVKVLKNRPEGSQETIEHGQVFKTEGVTLKAFHCPGHTVDHMAFILEEEDAIFTGDNVLGHGTAVFEDLATYLQSLEAMKQQFKGRAFPGHGDVIENGVAKIEEYISHRRQREDEILGVLKSVEAEGSTSMEIVKVVYRAYPESLWAPAEGGVVQVLKKLEGEGMVKADGGRWMVGSKSSL